ncbi:MAG: hypothetical protein ABJE95_00450 [Byssovorax sp.]
MRRVLGLLTVALCFASATAGAQTCPPSDPLCANNKSPPRKGAAVPTATESPAPTPAAPPALAAPDKATPEKTKSQRGVITLSEVTITGRIQKPIAAVDVSRIAPKLTLAELRQPFLDRIEEAVYKDPF